MEITFTAAEKEPVISVGDAAPRYSLTIRAYEVNGADFAWLQNESGEGTAMSEDSVFKMLDRYFKAEF